MLTASLTWNQVTRLQAGVAASSNVDEEVSGCKSTLGKMTLVLRVFGVNMEVFSANTVLQSSIYLPVNSDSGASD